MRKSLRFCSALLVCSILILSLSSAFAVEPPEQPAQVSPVENPEGIIGVIIELVREPLLASESAQQLGAGVYLSSPEAAAARTELLDAQQSVQDEIIDNIDAEAVFTAQYTNTINGFAAQVKRGDVARIKALAGVKAVYADVVYDAPEEVYEPQLYSSTSTIGATNVWSLPGYKGEGTVVAVIDTGVDVRHEAMVLSETTTPKLTKDSVGTVMNNTLNAESYANLTADDVYYNAKFPFCFDYADIDTDANADSSDHGVQVAGAIAANCDAAENAGASLHTTIAVNGVAPEAQIIGMKVFPSGGGGAPTSCTIAAVEDATALGADVICLALGSTAGFTFYEGLDLTPYEQEYSFAVARRAGVLVIASAGNDSRAGEGSYIYQLSGGGYAYPSTSYPDNGLLSSPATKYHATAVASINNTSIVEPYIQTTGGYKFIYRNANITDFVGSFNDQTLEYVICGIGNPSDFEGRDLEGKLALVERGNLSFTEKMVNSAAAGAVGVIVYNNEANGDVLVNPIVDGDETIPLILINRTSGLELLNAEEEDMSVSISTSYTEGIFYSLERGMMSDNSSWGATPDLKLKPELTAPGENIYTTSRNNKYVSASGNSMATAHIAGAAALMQQYVKANSKFEGFAGEEKANIIESLLMSSADIVNDENGKQYSPRRQGAGLADLAAAVASDVYLLNSSSGKAKIELGDRVGNSFSIEFDAYNLSAEARNYTITGSIMTDDAAKLGSYGYFIVPYSMNLNYSEMLCNGHTVNTLGSGATQTGITGPAIVTVPAGESVHIRVTVNMNDEETLHLASIFDNGFFLEGFIKLTSTDGNPDLSIPYMGFYGDWNKAPIIDGSYYFENYLDADGSRNYVYGRSRPYSSSGPATVALGGNYEGTMYAYPLIAFSPNGDGRMDNMGYEAYLLRNARNLSVYIIDSNGETVNTLIEDIYWKKAYYDAYNNRARSEMLNVWDGTDDSGQLVPEGQYYYVISATIDYPGATPQNTIIPVKLDTGAPALSDLQLDTDTMTLTGNASDSVSYLSHIDAKDIATGTVVRDVLEVPSNSHDFSLDLSAFSGGEIELTIYDVAGNKYTQAGINAPVDEPGDPGYIPELLVPVSSDEISVTVGATVTGDMANISVTSDQLRQIARAAEANNTLSVDVSELDVSSVRLSTALVGAISGANGLEVKLNSGSVTLERAALESVGGQSITVSVQSLQSDELSSAQKDALGEDAESAVIVDVNILVNGVKVSEFGGSHITVSIPYVAKPGEDTSKLAVYYLADDGTLTKMNGYYDVQKQAYVFTTIHLSDYVLVSEPAVISFTDVSENDWFFDDVTYVCKRGLMQGIGNGAFAPYDTTTRGMLVTILYRLEGQPSVTGQCPFSDVAAGKYYESAVTWAAANKLVNGCPDGSFAPEDPVTREQLAAILYRYAQFKGLDVSVGEDTNILSYADAFDIAEYAIPAFQWSCGAGLIGGSNGSLMPQGNAERCQVAAILHRFCESAK